MGRNYRQLCDLAAGSVLVLALSACGALEPELPGQSEAPLIYGSDDRREAYQASTATEELLFASETVLISKRSGLVTPSAGGYAIATTPTFADWLAPLCLTEPYRDQPVPGFCSGFMVGPDLIATAGHCITKKTDCADTYLVFGYHMLDASTPVTQVPSSDVYACAEIVGRVYTPTEDWSVVRVDRLIAGRTALPIRRTGSVGTDPQVAGLAVIGHPIGMPAKLASNAWVTDNGPAAYFQANVDTYAGNSGSAVVSRDAQGNLLFVEGILVRGNPDFVWTGTCYQSNVCSDLGCTGGQGSGWEEVTRSTTFASLLSVCGDSSCTGGETCSSCPADCGTCPVCGAVGAPCSTNADCCSGRCHPKLRVCK